MFQSRNSFEVLRCLYFFTMSKCTFSFRGLLQRWMVILLFGTIFGEMLTELQTPCDINVTEKEALRTRRSVVLASANAADSVNILTASHLSSLKELLSDRKITVRLGLRVSLTGLDGSLESQLPLLLKKEKSAIYNTGEKSGLFTMRVVGLKKVTSQKLQHPPAQP